MSTELNVSLLPRPGRQPIPTSLTARGNHRSSVFTAPLVHIAAANVLELTTAIDAADPLGFFLFTQDVPIILQLCEHYKAGVTVTTVETYTLPELDYRFTLPLNGTLATPSLAPFVSDDGSASIPYGQALKGTIAGAGLIPIPAVGYTASIAVPSTGGGTVANRIEVYCVSRGTLMDGPPGASLAAEPAGGEAVTDLWGYNGAGVEPNQGAVILEVSDYTQAMADAGNRWTFANGVADIVGVYNLLKV